MNETKNDVRPVLPGTCDDAESCLTPPAGGCDGESTAQNQGATASERSTRISQNRQTQRQGKAKRRQTAELSRQVRQDRQSRPGESTWLVEIVQELLRLGPMIDPLLRNSTYHPTPHRYASQCSRCRLSHTGPLDEPGPAPDPCVACQVALLAERADGVRSVVGKEL